MNKNDNVEEIENNENELEAVYIEDRVQSLEILTVLKQIQSNQKELNERIEELENKKTGMSEAALRLVNLMYDTDNQHLPELTRIPLNSVRPHALGMTLESILDEDVQSGKVPLSRILRNNYFRLMRSVNGKHLGNGIGLASDQSREEQEQENEDVDLGK